MEIRNFHIKPLMGSYLSRFDEPLRQLSNANAFLASDTGVVSMQVAFDLSYGSTSHAVTIIKEVSLAIELRAVGQPEPIRREERHLTLTNKCDLKVSTHFDLDLDAEKLFGKYEVVVNDETGAEPDELMRSADRFAFKAVKPKALRECIEVEGVGINFGAPLFDQDWIDADLSQGVPSGCMELYPNAVVEFFVRAHISMFSDPIPFRLRVVDAKGAVKSCLCVGDMMHPRADLPLPTDDRFGMVISSIGGVLDITQAEGCSLVLSAFSKVLAVVDCESLDRPGATLGAEDIQKHLPVSLAARMHTTYDDVVGEAADLSADEQLESMVGLKAVKRGVARFMALNEFARMRRNLNLSTSISSLHSVFYGNPGTGKTTVAKIMGEILRDKGVLSSGHVVLAERSTLLGENYGSAEKHTREVIAKSKGGILFIDEAYQLYNPKDDRDPGKEVVQTLMTSLADPEMRDWMLILAGYTDDMKSFFSINPGLESRIPNENRYFFDDYTPEELMEIALSYLKAHDYVLSAEEAEKLRARTEYDYAKRDKTFGYARYILNIIETEIIPSLAMRMCASEHITFADVQTILPCDVPDIPDDHPVDAPRRLGFGI